MTTTEFLWVEKYRPQTIQECILPERLKAAFLEIVATGNVPNLLLCGTAGVGKTTVAKALCSELGLNHLFINASLERGIDVLRTKIMNYASTVSLTGGRKVIILDEADYLTGEAQAGLRGAIEEFSNNVSFIFTCNFKARLIEAIHSRCAVIDFSLQKEERPKMALQLMKRLEYILNAENIEYDKAVLPKLIEKYFPDYRRILGEAQRYGKLDAGILVQISDVKKLDDLVRFLRDKNFGEMRKWVVSNSDLDAARIYKKIYDSLYTYFKPDSIPQAVLILAKYQYQAAFVADQELNLVAALTEIMIDCEIQ